MESVNSNFQTAQTRKLDYLFFLIITLCVGHKFIFPLTHVFGNDVLAMHIPLNALITQEGTYPVLWNPYSHCGTPALANPAYAMLNPIQALSLIIQPVYVTSIYLFVHIFIYTCGIWHWSKLFKLDKNTCYLVTIVHMSSLMFMGFLTFGHALIISTLSMSVWFFYHIQRYLSNPDTSKLQTLKTFSILSILSAYILINAGVTIIHHQYVSFILLMIGYLAIQKNIKFTFKVILLVTAANLAGGIMASAQLGPTFEFLNNSGRSDFFGKESNYSEGSLSPLSIIQNLSPLLFGNLNQYWGQYSFFFGQFYPGLAGSLLLMIGIIASRKNKEVVYYLISSILILGITFGKASPLFWLYIKIVPLADMFRYPSRYAIFAFILMTPFMGIGYQQIKSLSIKKIGFISAPFIALLALPVFISASNWKSVLPNHVFERYQSISNYEFNLSFISAEILSLIILILCTKSTQPFIKPISCLLVLLILSLGRFPGTHNGVPIERITVEPTQQPHKRFLTEFPMDFPNHHLFSGTKSASGYDSMFPSSYRAFLDTLTEQDWRKKTREQLHGLSQNELQYLGISAKLKQGQYFPDGEMSQVTPPGQLYYLTQTVPLPSREKSPAYPAIVSAQKEIEKELNSKEITTTEDLGQVKIELHHAEKVRLKVKVKARSILASSENNDPNWKAVINGKPQPSLLWFNTFRAFILDPGEYTIEMTYDRGNFYTYLFISILSWGVMIILWFTLNLKTSYQGIKQT